MSDTESKAGKKALGLEEIEQLRHEVEVLELQARRKVALETIRGDRSARQQAREQRKATQAARQNRR